MSSSEEDIEKTWKQEQELSAAMRQPEEEYATSIERVMTEKEQRDYRNAEAGDELGATKTLSQNITTMSATTEGMDDEDGRKVNERLKWYEWLDPLKRRKRPAVPDERSQSKEYRAGFFSVLTFYWMNSLMAVGYQRPLEINDLPQVNPNRSAEHMTTKLKDSFKRRRESGSKRPLAMALYDTFKAEFILGGLLCLTGSILQVLSPYILRYLIQFAGESYYAQKLDLPGPNIGHGLGLAFGITIMQVIQTTCINHFLYRGMVVGGQCRAALISVIFDKSLTLSGRAKAEGISMAPPPRDFKPGSPEEKKWYQRTLRKKRDEQKAAPKGDARGWNDGRIINLMSTDTQRIDLASGMFHIIWTSPLSILLTIALLLVNLTYSALAGIGILFISTPLLGMAIKSLFKRRAMINKITDSRVSLTQEIIQSVRFVKFFGWETSFLDRLSQIRKREINYIQLLLTVRNAINAVSMAMPVFAAMLAFVTYSLTSHVLDPAPIFSSLALFNSLRLPLMLLPLVLGQVIDGLASLERIQDYLQAEEAEEAVDWNYDMKDAIKLTDGSYTWEKSSKRDDEGGVKGGRPRAKPTKEQKKAEKRQSKEAARKNSEERSSGAATPDEEQPPFAIRDLNLSVGRNELVAIIGTVGSGKSSVLTALAGDMRMTSGKLALGASRAFCPQYAWIRNATVRENIIFGKPFDPVWYEKVVDACALRPDFQMLPYGDQTEIGERGITVSGGQKQRLNIARAIYFNADIVLMDDPLSAVDAHVGRHIFDHAILGLLGDKCRVLATHQLHVLHRCDRIVWMQDGKIATIDTYDNLMANNEDFRTLLSTTVQEDEDSEDEGKDAGRENRKGKKSRSKSKSKKQAPALMQMEERAVDSVPWSTYYSYVKASGSVMVAPLVLITLILSQCANIGTALWLSWWSSDKFHLSEGAYIGIYAALGVAQAFLMFSFAVVLSVFSTRASKVMFQRAMHRVLRAPTSFFDTTPIGRIINRFSKDVDIMDNNLSDSIRMYFLTLAMIVAVFALIIAYFPFFAVALGPLFLLFLLAASYYRKSAREIKRMEAVLRSHVYSRFTESIAGISTIRAYQLQDNFSSTLRKAIDDQDSAYFITFANQRWLSIRLDMIGNLLVLTVGILVVTSRFNVNPSTAGLVLSYILSIVSMIQFTVRQLAEVENNMNATERVHYYGTQLEQEPPLQSSPQISPSWPQNGEIIFNDVEMRYRPGLPLVLSGFSLHVKPGERIGVVGRTGAGKSSVMTALFRLVDVSSGSISIDGIDIRNVGLSDLRSRLAIIPQDPTLFRGTVRSNLDPFAEHDDTKLWNALRQSGLVSDPSPTSTATEMLPATDAPATVTNNVSANAKRLTLDSPVEDSGLNFSLGQRQLMALARALVRDARIIVCDEATSSVDTATDARIQRTMQESFAGKTLLCIAHRLKTILSYDRIVVMDRGGIAEVGTPVGLYEERGVFWGMCERGGVRRGDFAMGEAEKEKE